MTDGEQNLTPSTKFMAVRYSLCLFTLPFIYFVAMGPFAYWFHQRYYFVRSAPPVVRVGAIAIFAPAKLAGHHCEPYRHYLEAFVAEASSKSVLSIGGPYGSSCGGIPFNPGPHYLTDR